MADILIKNGLVITIDKHRRVIKDGAVAISGNRIVGVNKASKIKDFKPEIIIDAKNKAVLPGLINAHGHTHTGLMRGLADDVGQIEMVYNRVMPFEANMTAKDVRYGTLLTCLEMIKSGTTCFAEPMAHARHIDEIFKAVKESKIRGVISRCTMDKVEPDRPLPKSHLDESPEKGIKAFHEVYKKWNGTGNGKIKVWPGLRQIVNSSEELIRGFSELSLKMNIGLNAHVAYAKQNVEWMIKKFGFREVEYLEHIGVLNSNWLMAHAVHFSDKEVDILKKHDVKIAHCPMGSMHAAYGSSVVGKFPEMMAEGITVALGTDAPCNNNAMDMLQDIRMVASIHKEARQQLPPATPSPEDALEMATTNGAKALLDDTIGSIEVGKKADVILIDLKKPRLVPLLGDNIVPLLVYAANGEDVDTVIVDGEILMENRVFQALDEAKILAESQELAQDIIQRSGIKIPSMWKVT